MPPEPTTSSETRARGEVTFSNVDGLRPRSSRPALGDGARNLVIDLTDVTFIDSSGPLGAADRLGARRASAAAPSRSCSAQGEPPSIFRFRGVDRLLALYPSRDAALAGL